MNTLLRSFLGLSLLLFAGGCSKTSGDDDAPVDQAGSGGAHAGVSGSGGSDGSAGSGGRAGGGMMGAPNKGVTSEVDASVGDASAPSGGGDAGEEPRAGEPGSVLCNPRVAAVHDSSDVGSVIDIWWDDFSPKLAVDKDGSVLFAITYQGTLDLADGTSVTAEELPSGYAGYGVLIGKYSAACEPLWFTTIEDSNEPMLAVDSRGHVIVASRTVAEQPEAQDLLLSAFDAGGAPLWANHVTGATPGLHWQGALRVDAADDIVWLTAARSGSDFGGGTLGVGTSLDPTMEVLAKFDGAGHPVWSHVIQESLTGNGQENGTHASMAIANGTDIVFHGASIYAQDWGAAGHTQATQAEMLHGYLVRADAAGDYLTSERIGDGDGAASERSWIDVGGDGRLILSRLTPEGLVVRSGSDVVWSKPVITPDVGFLDDWHKTALDGDDAILIGGNFRTSTVVNGVALSAPGDTNLDAFVQKLGPSGDTRWTYASADAFGRDEWLLGMAAAGTGKVAALIGSLGDDTRALYLIELAP
jgi:hypothetical protein